MPFSQQGDAPLSAVVNVRLTVDEKATLLEEASSAGMTLSKLARRRLLGWRVLASVDAAMIRELRRLGGLVKHVNQSSGGAYSAETQRALRTLTIYISELATGASGRRQSDDR